MYYEVASKMVVATGTANVAFTQAVSMDGANTALSEFTNYTSGTATVSIDEGNDLENWGTNSGTALAGPGYGTISLKSSARFVRLRIIASGATVVLGAGINTSQQ